MKSQQHSLLFLATTLLITLPSHSGLAFSIGPQPPANYVYSSSYTKDLPNGTGTIVGTVSLDAWPRWDPRRYGIFQGKVLPIRRGGTNGLLRLLSRQFPNWEFSRGRDISGSFDIQRYRVCTPIFPFPNGYCGLRSDGSVRDNGVGARFRLNYNPTPSDPQGDNIHWIQRFISNLSEDGSDVDLIDIRPGQGDPFYDTFGNAGPTFFSDVPWDRRFYLNRFFYAETYIVKEIISPPNTGNPSIVKRKVEIYNGVRWGFENQQRCDPASGGGGCVLPPNSTRVVSANAESQGLDNNSTENFAFNNASLTMEDEDIGDISAHLLEDPELSYVDDILTPKTQKVSSKNTDDDALSVEAVPEPTTALGTLFALAVLPVIKRFTNRKNKE